MDYKTLYELFMEKKKEHANRWDYELILDDVLQEDKAKAMGVKQHED